MEIKDVQPPALDRLAKIEHTKLEIASVQAFLTLVEEMGEGSKQHQFIDPAQVAVSGYAVPGDPVCGDNATCNAVAGNYWQALKLASKDDMEEDTPDDSLEERDENTKRKRRKQQRYPKQWK